MAEGRNVEQVVVGQVVSDGAGVKLRRTLGTAAFDHFDPFLLLDEFRSDDGADYIAGFPDHPHRGFETVTYMLAGAMEHRDHRGNVGRLSPGAVQWMTAGRGIVHSEMPQQEDGLMWGFQLWVNLPAKDKMCEPRYQEFEGGAVPVVEGADGQRCRVIAGSVGDVQGLVQGIATDPMYLDVELPASTVNTSEVQRGHHACVYVYQGAITLGQDDGKQDVSEGQLAILSDGDHVVAAAAAQAARFLLLAGRPLGEPIARAGPFVMNTRAEIVQAMQDYQAGRLAT